MNFLAATEGPGQIEVEYSAINRAILIILENDLIYPEGIREDQITKFEDWLYTHDYMHTSPTLKDILRYSEVFCGFTFTTSPDAFK